MGRRDWSGPRKKGEPARDTHALRQIWDEGKKERPVARNLTKGFGTGQDTKKKVSKGHSLAHVGLLVLVIHTVRGRGKRTRQPQQKERRKVRTHSLRRACQLSSVRSGYIQNQPLPVGFLFHMS